MTDALALDLGPSAPGSRPSRPRSRIVPAEPVDALPWDAPPVVEVRSSLLCGTEPVGGQEQRQTPVASQPAAAPVLARPGRPGAPIRRSWSPEAPSLTLVGAPPAPPPTASAIGTTDGDDRDRTARAVLAVLESFGPGSAVVQTSAGIRERVGVLAEQSSPVLPATS